jgi:chemotaxis protein methyltransferase CheR
MIISPITERDFIRVRDWLYQKSGIYLNESKRSLVSGRLNKRLRDLDLNNFSQYIDLLLSKDQAAEQQTAVNILTTNETYFYREEKHFDFLQKLITPELKSRCGRDNPFTIWSAASSTGQEAYSIAMTLAEQFKGFGSWQVVGTDINTSVIETARHAVYPIEAARKIPSETLKSYCLKGRGKDDGWFRLSPEIRERVSFDALNLMAPSNFNYKFDVIFLRNVLIYFELADKQKVVNNVLRYLKPGGHLLVGHSETIHGYDTRLEQLQPSCYRLLK